MDLQQIIDLIQSGATDERLEQAIHQWQEDNPDEADSAFRGGDVYTTLSSELSKGQLESFGDVYGQATLGRDLSEFLTTIGIGGVGARIGAKVLGSSGGLLAGIKNVLAGNKLRKGITAGVTLGGAAFGVSGIPELESAGESSNPAVTEGEGGSTFSPEVSRAQPKAPAQLAAPGTQVDPGYQVMVVDRSGDITGVPGQVFIIPTEAFGSQYGVSPNTLQELENTLSFGSGPGVQGVGGTDLINGYVAGGVSGLQIDDRIKQVISPRTLGDVKINAPAQLPSAGPLPDVRPAPPGVDQKFWEVNAGARQPGGPPIAEGMDTRIPAGAQIAPRVFQETRGRTLLEWASIIAQRNGVPLNILYGIIDHESNWLPTAEGDNGDSHGLAQIHLPSFKGRISASQARDPIFALEFTAKLLKERFQKYGRWDAAIAAHNDPSAADYLASNNKYQNAKSANYVTDIMETSNMSGLADYQFGDEVVNEIAGGGGGGGVSYSPYQSPDPASSREFIESTYRELLGRGPTEAEFTKEIQRIERLAQQSYQANLTQAKGGKSQAVDVEAQFREGIRDTGEFDFNESTHQLDSFTDYAAGIANLLQQGL